MKKNIVLLILIIILLFIVGLSIINYLQRGKIEFIDMNKELSCICNRQKFYPDKEFIINSDEEYNALLEFKSSWCEDFTLPYIDFSRNTLLGKFTSAGGCRADFKRRLYKDNSNKKIIYLINIFTEGVCDAFFESMNWALIPKIPSDYEVEFKINRK